SGRLRKRTSGVDRSQAAFGCWGDRPRKGDWSDLWLDVIMGRETTPNRSVVTAAKWVYSTWQFKQRPGERHGEAIYRDRPAPQPVHLLHPTGERADVRKRMEAGRLGEVGEEAAAERRGGRRDHRQHAAVLRRSGAACGARSGSRYQPVPDHQPIGEENRSARCSGVVAVLEQWAAAGGADER